MLHGVFACLMPAACMPVFHPASLFAILPRNARMPGIVSVNFIGEMGKLKE